jgi:PAS domain S-box-containing protein
VSKVVLDRSLTIAEIVRQHEETRSVLLKYGLLLNEIGGRSLADVCAERGIDLAIVERELAHAVEESEPFAHGGYEWDADAGVVRMSRSVGAMLGIVELTGSPSALLARVHPDDRERVRQLFQDARERHRAFSFECRILELDGSTRIHASQVEPIDGVARFIGMIWDITEQRADPGALLRSTMDATADGILVVDRAGNITTYNQRFLAFWGISNELVATRSDDALLRYVLDQLEDPGTFEAIVQMLYANPERESFDVLRFKDGRVFERYSRPQRVAFAIVGRVWSFRDVTERERIHAASTLLIDASRLLASLDVHSALDAVVRIALPALGDAGTIEVFEGPRISVSHSLDPARLPPPSVRADVHAGHAAFDDGDDRSHLSVPVLIKDHVVGALAFVASVRRRHTRADLSLAERLAQRIAVSIENARLYDGARAALAARDEFLAIAAHELRGPLSAMNLAIQALKGRDLSQPMRERMQALVERECQRLRRFADDVTDITRIRAGTLRFDDAPVDLLDVAREAVARLEPDIRRSHSTVSIEGSEAVVGQWDRFRLDQVVTNLVSNALKFGLGQPIEVAATAKDGCGTLIVGDHGLGVPSSQRETIFRPFERAVSVRHYGGLGLGLFIVRTIVSRYGGTVEVEPRDPAGSRFVVRIPQTRST